MLESVILCRTKKITFNCILGEEADYGKRHSHRRA